MNPIDILKLLDLAKVARSQKRTFNPLFAGDAGIGKSEICQAWVKKQQETDPDFGFIDLRLAYMEGPDFVGLPDKVTVNGVPTTVYFLPEFLPAEGTRGLFLLEEPNRGNTSVTNCLMQLLTDRRIGKKKIPDGWIIAGAINPDNSNYDVNTMDTALRDRFVPYNVEYDFKTFVSFMKERNWHPSIISFVESGAFTYKRPDEIGENGKYVSPRTFSALNSAELAGLETSQDLHFETSKAILGNAVGREYYKYRFEQTPVLVNDLLENEKAALKKLKGYCGSDYKGDMVLATRNSVVEHYPEKVDDKLLIKVAKIIPKDQAVGMLRECIAKTSKDGKNYKTLGDFLDKDPELKEAIKNGLREKKAVDTNDI